jgi:hypothetical protein
MEKQAVAGKVDGEAARTIMDAIGCTDSVDQDRLMACLDVIRDYGAALPAEPSNGAAEKKDPATEIATDAQLALIAKLVKEKRAASPDLPLTKAQAHEVIDTLKAGTYDPVKWSVPF